MKGFMKQLEEALNSSFGIYMGGKRVYTDKKLQPGDDFEKKLAKAICRSVCFIVVYTPSYEESDFCLREFAAMENIEDRRMQLIGKKLTCDERLIIPIILRGEKKDLPPKISANIQYCDCSDISLSSFICDIYNHPSFIDKMEEIVKKISKHYKIFDIVDVHSICESFEIPKEGIIPWRDRLFNWEKIENDTENLIKYLKMKFGIDWTKATEIKKSDDGRTIKILFGEKDFLLILNDEKTRVKIETYEGRTDEFIAKTENGNLNIYKKSMDSFPNM